MVFFSIRVHGHLADHYAAWFSPLTITREQSGETLLAGDLADQGALFGLLLKIRDLGLPLLAVERHRGEAAPGPLVIISCMTVRPGSEPLLLDRLGALVEQTRAEPACLAYDVYRHASEPQRFVFVERFADRAGFDLHLCRPYTQEWIAFAQAAGAHFDVDTWMPLA